MLSTALPEWPCLRGISPLYEPSSVSNDGLKHVLLGSNFELWSDLSLLPGTTKWVHRKCLDQWRANGQGRRTFTHCPNCQFAARSGLPWSVTLTWFLDAHSVTRAGSTRDAIPCWRFMTQYRFPSEVSQSMKQEYMQTSNLCQFMCATTLIAHQLTPRPPMSIAIG